ncbi:MAG: ArgE/DapE family deacylase [Candidatus Dormibacteraeota bacterium]|nr:ArgE/DapE family deacylase [Candidatus Dormibacteraeota bacterium]
MTEQTARAAREAVRDAVERGWDDEVAFLRALVGERSLRGMTAGAQLLVERRMRELALQPERVAIEVEKLRGRPGYSPVDWSSAGEYDLSGRLPGATSDGRSLILNGHVDVVPSTPDDHWTRDPWGGEIEGGRMYGRGAADMKAGVAAILAVVAAVRAAGVTLRGSLELQSVVEEECSGHGTLALLEAGHRADAAIVPESTGQSLCTAHPGVLWCRVAVQGLGAHAETADAAVNAIERLWPLIAAVRELEAEVNQEAARHPAFAGLAHPLNYNLGTLHAGDWPSSVPEAATMEIRFSYPPGESVAGARRRIEEHLRRAAEEDPWLREVPPEITWFGFAAEPAVYDTDDVLSRTLEQNHLQTVGKALARRPFAATIDNRFFALYAGMPTACYGPTGDRYHAPDESVDLATVLQTTHVLAGTVLDWCGVA